MKQKQSRNYFIRLARILRRTLSWLWRSLWRRTLTIIAVVCLILLGLMYGVAEWYIHQHANQPLELGTTFIPDYARQLELDPDKTLQAILRPKEQGGLGMKHVRLVSYWEDIEATPGIYNFAELDRQFAMAKKYDAKISLAIGLRQPRWPECHQPGWAASEPKEVWELNLFNFIRATVNHYKGAASLESYQLENEFFMKIFGKCTNFDRSRFIAETNLVKTIDPSHKLIISRSNNWIGWPVRQPTPDEFGVSVYKRVWDYHFTRRYVEYPLPPWYYSFLAGMTQILTGKNTMIHELQAEPWLPNSLKIDGSTLDEQAKSINPQRLKDRISYAKDTGMKSIELWGAEYWYWMKVKHNNPGYWQVVQRAVETAEAYNQRLGPQGR